MNTLPSNRCEQSIKYYVLFITQDITALKSRGLNISQPYIVSQYR